MYQIIKKTKTKKANTLTINETGEVKSEKDFLNSFNYF